MYHVLKMSCSGIRHSRPRRSKGFTLIELLVVVAIIALLVAILVPSLEQAREAAKNVICQSSLHQVSIAASMYINDNDGSFFWQRGNRYNIPGEYPSPRPWFHSEGVLSPYLLGDAEEVARNGCPTNDIDDYFGSNYIGNRHILSLTTSEYTMGYPPPSKVAKIKKPSRKIVILEVVPDVWTYDGFDYSHGRFIGTYHQGNTNILWADLHVAPMLKIDLEWLGDTIATKWVFPEED